MNAQQKALLFLLGEVERQPGDGWTRAQPHIEAVKAEMALPIAITERYPAQPKQAPTPEISTK